MTICLKRRRSRNFRCNKFSKKYNQTNLFLFRFLSHSLSLSSSCSSVRLSLLHWYVHTVKWLNARAGTVRNVFKVLFDSIYVFIWFCFSCPSLHLKWVNVTLFLAFQEAHFAYTFKQCLECTMWEMPRYNSTYNNKVIYFSFFYSFSLPF